MKILIADDDPNILIILKRVLQKNKHEILAAKDGQEAVDFFNKEHPDLAVLDINMPQLTGWDVLHEIRLKNKTFPVILLTVQTGLKDQIKGYNEQADYYLSKPFEPALLLAYVHRCENKIKKTS